MASVLPLDWEPLLTSNSPLRVESSSTSVFPNGKVSACQLMSLMPQTAKGRACLGAGKTFCLSLLKDSICGLLVNAKGTEI